MASLWTPEGEHRVPTDTETTPAEQHAGTEPEHFDPNDPDIEAVRAEFAQLEQELLSAPAQAVIANHCYGFFQLAALHLSQRPPRLEDARLAIDALAAVVDSLGDRLGEALETLQDALAQMRLAYVQIAAVQSSENGNAGTDEPPSS